MGMDIHMHIVKNGKVLAENIFEGRNSQWFANISCRSGDDDYNNFPNKVGLSPQAPEKFKDCYTNRNEYGFFDFYYVNVKDFIKWFDASRPDIDAGWITTYDKWKWEKKGIYPDEIHHYLDEDDNVNDMHFVEVSDKYDCSREIFHIVLPMVDDGDADITYWFDC